MSGFYNNWFKVNNPNASNDITPMVSGGSQVPFFFGGSQVPTGLELHNTDLNLTGGGLKHYNKIDFMHEKLGKGVQSSKFNRQTNIHLPRHMGSLSKQF